MRGLALVKQTEVLSGFNIHRGVCDVFTAAGYEIKLTSGCAIDCWCSLQTSVID